MKAWLGKRITDVAHSKRILGVEAQCQVLSLLMSVLKFIQQNLKMCP